MILSAGFGTRLKLLTDKLPKALVNYKNVPMINYQIERLKKIGVDEIVINAHHLSEKIEEYFRENNFGVKINVLLEDEILGTGGGIINAQDFLKDEKNFFVINVDVDTDMNLLSMMNDHLKKNPLATLAIQKRVSNRYLEFNSRQELIGKETPDSKKENLFAFNGIHIISNRIFEKGLEKKFGGILEIYFKLIQEGEIVLGFDTGKSSFKDLGKIENFE